MLAFVVGACFGSFANVLIYRLPKNVSIIKLPSACVSCEKRLKPLDLIPVLSWLYLRGKCRYCKAKISVAYPVTELVCGLLFVASFVLSPDISAVFIALFSFILLCIAVIDYKTMLIPDSLVIFGAITGLTWVVLFGPSFAPNWYDSLLGIIFGFFPLFAIDKICLLLYKKDGFGYGDMKLMAMAGIFLGWTGVLMAFFIAIITGGTYGAFLILTKRATKGAYFAFGPFLCGGAYLSLWLREALIRLYFG